MHSAPSQASQLHFHGHTNARCIEAWLLDYLPDIQRSHSESCSLWISNNPPKNRIDIANIRQIVGFFGLFECFHHHFSAILHPRGYCIENNQCAVHNSSQGNFRNL